MQNAAKFDSIFEWHIKQRIVLITMPPHVLAEMFNRFAY
jgi:hypothetical protein